MLVHGDASLVRLEETFPRAAEIAGKLHYTGLIADIPEPAAGPSDGVVVSAGGGAFSETLLAAAMEARPLTRLADSPWRLIAGPNLGADAAERLRARAPEGAVVEPFRDDFPRLLAGHPAVDLAGRLQHRRRRPRRWPARRPGAVHRRRRD